MELSIDNMSEASLNASSMVSVVVCVRNGANILGNCLLSTLENSPKEIIVVDGLSTDNTVELAQSYQHVRVISDEGKGLAYARRIAVEEATGDYILFVGPDNIMEKEFINNFVRLKKEWGFDAASVQTRVLKPVTFWDKGLDFRWKCLMGKPGPLRVVGTPSLYDSKLFEKVKFSLDNVGPHDDTDVADQLRHEGFKLGLVPLLVYDQNGWNRKTTWNRFKWYGTGDFYYYSKYKSSWSFGRRLFSLSHPLRQTWAYALQALSKINIIAIPWLIFTMTARYYGWISMSFNRKKK